MGMLLPGRGVVHLPLEDEGEGSGADLLLMGRMGADIGRLPLGIAVGIGGGFAASPDGVGTTVEEAREDARECRRLRAAGGVWEGLMVMTSKSSAWSLKEGPAGLVWRRESGLANFVACACIPAWVEFKARGPSSSCSCDWERGCDVGVMVEVLVCLLEDAFAGLELRTRSSGLRALRTSTGLTPRELETERV